MKKYTLEWLYTNQRLTRATRPKPFPGKYPTRIAVKAKFTNGKTITYIGKPAAGICKKLRLWRNSYTLIDFWGVEFDRNGVLIRDKSVNPIQIRGQQKTQRSELRYEYHPANDRYYFFNRDGRWVDAPGLRNGRTRRLFAVREEEVPTQPDVNELQNTLRQQLMAAPPIAPPPGGVAYRVTYRAVDPAMDIETTPFGATPYAPRDAQQAPQQTQTATGPAQDWAMVDTWLTTPVFGGGTRQRNNG